MIWIPLIRFFTAQAERNEIMDISEILNLKLYL